MTIRNAPADPILVSDSTAPAAILTAVRYVITAVGGYLVSRGAITADTLQMILGVVGAVAPNLIGVFLSIRNKRKLITAAEAAPNSVAKVTP